MRTKHTFGKRIVFRGLYHSRVPDYLMLPKIDTPPYPSILLAHGMGGFKESGSELEPDKSNIIRQLQSKGFAVQVLDSPYRGERSFEIDFESIFSYTRPKIYRELIIQWTVEYHKAMDYLATRPEVDISRIGILGYSLGGVMAYTLTAIDSRKKAAVIGSTAPLTRHYINVIGWDETALARMLPIAPQTFAPAIKSTPLLVLNGRNDPFGTLEAVEDLYK